MDLGFMFFFEAVLIGIALAMDAFSVSLANGLNEPGMPKPKMLGVAGMFALFQAAMPLIGWICVKTIVETFGFLEGLLPWITLEVLGFIGAKMLIDSLHPDCDEERAAAGECSMTKPLAFGALVVQAIATSIDALSAGFTISDYNPQRFIYTCWKRKCIIIPRVKVLPAKCNDTLTIRSALL